MINYRNLFRDFSIEYDDETALHRGFLAVPCPFCGGGSKLYGAVHIYDNYFNCWKCGHHSIYDFIHALTGQNWYRLSRNYENDDIIIKHTTITERPQSLSLPPGTGEMNAKARAYLTRRGFDPDILINNYNLKGTGPHGDYKFRIIIPIYFQHKLVSYTSRDYTGMDTIRYKTCRKDDEVLNHKTIVYGYDRVKTNHVIAVEGPVDKWKMGDSAVATFGTGFKREQVNILASFDKITLLYDSEPDAVRRADTLAGLLAGIGKDVDVITLKEGDPGELSLDEAESLTKEILNFS